MNKVIEPLSIELSGRGAIGFSLRPLDVPSFELEKKIPQKLLRKEEVNLPQLSENEAFRHFFRLSKLNYAVDQNIYPLGSCTMKYNPKVNEDVARIPGFVHVHPHTPDEFVQGSLRVAYELQELLKVISGMDAVSLQPVAGAQGELTGVFIIQAYHRSKGEKRDLILIPDSAHGTNPATATLAGLKAIEIKTEDTEGILTADRVKEMVDRYGERIAGLMITNPNTLGIFEAEIMEIAEVLHSIDAQLYMDGANMNALVGHVLPAELGVDVMHFNLHKTFSTPHGGGGPGSGAVGVKKHLEPFLPVPRIEKDGDRYVMNWDYPQSIGKLHAFYGNYNIYPRALTYILMMGDEGLKKISEIAVLNATYLRKKLENRGYRTKFSRPTMHEFVLSLVNLKKEFGVKALDVAKRLLDYGLHAPTVYFPLIVEEAFMVEPTESESKRSLDNFAEVMRKIYEESLENPDVVRTAPHNTPVGRLDEVRAAKELKVSWRDGIED